jgi:uncharacterized repeat protein (TIGR03987 family)
MLVVAVTFIFSALVFYTVGVWAEKMGGRLKAWHAIVFWLGFACDTIGTTAMGRIAGGIFQFNFHGITGLLAILLMLFHATWATIVLARKDEKLITSFHRLSVFVWCVWLVPMLSGMIFGMVS